MALLELSFFSPSLEQNSRVFVALPEPGELDGTPMKTLWMLHGYSGDCTDWQRKTGIERHAIARRVAVIMPDADCKMFVFASAKARAERRYKELIEKGQDVNFDDVLADIELRDKNDRERAIAPCVPADDAILLDNSEINFEETVEAALKIIGENVK